MKKKIKIALTWLVLTTVVALGYMLCMGIPIVPGKDLGQAFIFVLIATYCGFLFSKTEEDEKE